MARERSTWTSYAVAMARTRSWPLQPACWATANRGGMLSPGWEYSAARNVSWKSSSRTAAQLAQAAHSGDTQAWLPHPKTAAPGWSRWRRAWARALATGRRRREAAATPASSIRRLTTISVTSASTRTSSVATEASLQANCCSRGSVSELLCVRTSCSTTGPPSLGRSLRGPQICRRGASTWLGPVVPAAGPGGRAALARPGRRAGSAGPGRRARHLSPEPSHMLSSATTENATQIRTLI